MEKPVDFFLEEDATLKDAMRDHTIIDVREAWEGQVRPVAHALHIPFTAFTAAPLENVAKDASILVVCAHGKRSEVAALALRRAGWINAQSLAGGVEALPFARTGV